MRKNIRSTVFVSCHSLHKGQVTFLAGKSMEKFSFFLDLVDTGIRSGIVKFDSNEKYPTRLKQVGLECLMLSWNDYFFSI